MIGKLVPLVIVASTFAAQQGATFRATGRLVLVHTSVKAGNVPLPDLTVADFRLWDAGIEQQVTGVEFEEVPIDVTLFVDNSGSTFGSHEQFDRDIRKIAGLLRSSDRVRAVGFDLDVRVLMDWTAPGSVFALPPVRLARLSSVYDGLYLSMLHRPEPGRRHLIVAMTDGIDYGSVVRSRAIEDLAGRTEGVLHLLTVTARSVSAKGAPGVAGIPPDPDGPERLERAAQRTGGVAHSAIFSVNVVEFFKKAFDDFRSSYILRYTPAGVPAEGWHSIKVDVKRPGRLAVRHRQGYFGDPDSK